MITVTGDSPVQGEGVYSGHPWYFRSRGNAWQFYIADNPTDDPVHLCLRDSSVSGWSMDRDWMIEDRWAASHMPHRLAVRIIGICLRWFDAGLLDRREATVAL